MTAVAGVVVTHGADPDLNACLTEISDQVDELVVIANLPDPLGPVPTTARVIQNARPQGFSFNANLGIAATHAPFIVVVNPDAVAMPGAVARLVHHAELHPQCGIVGPQLVYPDGRWQASRRKFPTLTGTAVRRTPLRYVLDPQRFSRSHFLLDERPIDPVEADWMLGAFLLLRRSMIDEIGGFDEGFRLYGEDVELCYRAQKAGWERWYVPEAVVRHRLEMATGRRFLTRRTIWHWCGMMRFVRKYPERLKALW